MIYRQDGRKWTLPDTLAIPPYRQCFYTVEYRAPKKGEWYLSGAIVGAYDAKHDMDDKFLVATPTYEALTPQEYNRKYNDVKTNYLQGDKI